MIKKTWSETELKAWTAAIRNGKLLTMADIRARCNGRGAANGGSIKAWSEGEKVELWKGLLAIGERNANWEEITVNVNRNGPPRDVSVSVAA